MLNWRSAKWASFTPCAALATRHHMSARKESGINDSVHTNATGHGFQQSCQPRLSRLQSTNISNDIPFYKICFGKTASPVINNNENLTYFNTMLYIKKKLKSMA
jgi:hypothetical protein